MKKTETGNCGNKKKNDFGPPLFPFFLKFSKAHHIDDLRFHAKHQFGLSYVVSNHLTQFSFYRPTP